MRKTGCVHRGVEVGETCGGEETVFAGVEVGSRMKGLLVGLGTGCQVHAGD